jgi:predicted nicotinamide N-methyase
VPPLLWLQGFASTVWDSSIVLSKYLELRHAVGSLSNTRAVELGSGCGLVSCVLARLGADVTATDMEGNLPLLGDNLRANGAGGSAGTSSQRLIVP